jgi:hypothetical protein
MEKRDRFSDLRRGIIPNLFLKRYRSIANLIIRTTNVDTSIRPDIMELVNSIEDEIFSLENDYCVITNYRKSKSDKIIENDYVLIEDIEAYTSIYRTMSSDNVYDGYFEEKMNPCKYDYSWDVIIMSRNT